MPCQTSLTRLEQVPEERCMTVEVEVPKEVEEEVCQEEPSSYSTARTCYTVPRQVTHLHAY